MFDLVAFNAELAADNSHYERILTSDLHILVELLQNGGMPPMAAVATEMRKISLEKWRKYSRVKTYLLAEIPGLAAEVRAYLGMVSNFRTRSMNPVLNGRIEHIVEWGSSSGNIADLSHVRTRECVAWGSPAQEATPYLMGEYSAANQHNGLGSNSAETGQGTDTHDPVGPFTSPKTMKYDGGEVFDFDMNQTYEYSDDGGKNWLTILNSNYTIKRQLASNAGRPKLTVTKTCVANTGDSCTNSVEL